MNDPDRAAPTDAVLEFPANDLIELPELFAVFQIQNGQQLFLGKKAKDGTNQIAKNGDDCRVFGSEQAALEFLTRSVCQQNDSHTYEETWERTKELVSKGDIQVWAADNRMVEEKAGSPESGCGL